MLTIARRVGTAPGTTTLMIRDGVTNHRSNQRSSNGLGVWQCPPEPLPIHLAPWQGGGLPPYYVIPTPRPLRKLRVWNPYPTPADLRSSDFGGPLGYVIEPWEVNRSLPGGPPFLKPFDAFYNTRGECGFYYDTQFGEIPTDAELGPSMCYTPVKSAWIKAKEGYIPPPWIPPGYYAGAPYGPPISLDGGSLDNHLGATVDELTKHQRGIYYLTLLSTVAAVSVAAVSVVRYVRERKRERKRS